MPRPASYYVLSALFAAFLLFLYGPMLCVYILSFQGPSGGMSFPMRGVSMHWYAELFRGGARGTGDIGNAFLRSLRLALIVAPLTMLIGLAAGMAYRRRFPGADLLFYASIGSLIVPGTFVGFGIALCLAFVGMRPDWWYSGVGAQLTLTLPVALIVMFNVLGRFDPAYEEVATDLGATSRQRFQWVILPIILPGVIGLFSSAVGTSYQEAARAGINLGSGNTVPMELGGIFSGAVTPAMFAIGTVTSVAMFAFVIGTLLVVGWLARARRMQQLEYASA